MERVPEIPKIPGTTELPISGKRCGRKTACSTSSPDGYTDIKTLVAFSGTVIDHDNAGADYTEVSMNSGIKERELPDQFGSDHYQVLLVADKYQTGFDQPLLHTMYVDKRLLGIQAVQTLSRLNRTRPGKEETFVLDFVNEGEDIAAAFQPYYEAAEVGERVEARHLYELQARLDSQQVYYKAEVDAFAEVFFKPTANQTPTDHARINAAIDPAVGRFRALDEETREDYRKVLFAFRNLYSFLSQIIPFRDIDLEKLYAFVRFLLVKLPRRDSGRSYAFDDEVSLKYYRLQKIGEGSIVLDKGMPHPISGPTEVGTSMVREDYIELSRLIDLLNERFGTEFKASDQLFFDSIKEDALADSALRQAAAANTMENFGYVFFNALEGLFIDRMESNEEIAAKFMNDKAFQKSVGDYLLRQVYEQVNEAA